MKPLRQAALALSVILLCPGAPFAQNAADGGNGNGANGDGNWQARQQAQYQACMAKAAARPKTAFDEATTWEGLGGGYPARHCALAALIELGHYYEAAQGLENLAQRMPATAAFKSQLLVQAARAWIAAGNSERGGQVATAAINLLPDAGDVALSDALIARARASALQDGFWDAADDLSRVLYAEPQHVEALVLRGAAYRQLQAFDLALDDLTRALEIDPTHPEGLLERGIVHRLNGNDGAARRDWQTLIDAHADTPAARRARANLHALNSGVQ